MIFSPPTTMLQGAQELSPACYVTPSKSYLPLSPPLKTRISPFAIHLKTAVNSELK